MNQQKPQAYKLPDLSYDFNALEPVISAEIMSLHYTKHHQTYVTNLNKALEQYLEAEANNDLSTMIALQSVIKFNGGGHVNHSIFWTNLAPKNKAEGMAPEGILADAINKEFGSLQTLIEQLSAKTVAIQGSGWGWLGYDKAKDRLTLATCENQDPLSTKGLIPLLGIDVWEHAYYLQYKNVRADYVKNIWNIINWKNVAERYQAAKTK
ncbi:Superoxide dismutase [Mn], mitochondrial [Candidatus Protochlamydia amoebophila]|uniref:Fe-Mn family superoxide dismutase n=1 Tax=Candidatus Protochlamydia amoebophila TaxID=362787 RepID=UPI001BC92899|nr:Fe-Mn family superoxide dismutase [Candidatus Protochlamydia amoebophila]MBS4164419.1 Superoxide dismutase [Mn], mitochondrial [Candidatus Protochlamydia amoebophila]